MKKLEENNLSTLKKLETEEMNKKKGGVIPPVLLVIGGISATIETGIIVGNVISSVIGKGDGGCNTGECNGPDMTTSLNAVWNYTYRAFNPEQ